MTNHYKGKTIITRRNFLGSGIAAVTALSIAEPSRIFAAAAAPAAAAAKPNSVFAGVKIGAITYSYRGIESTAEGTLAALVEDGLSEVELMSGPVNSYIGLGGGGRGAGMGGAAGARGQGMGQRGQGQPAQDGAPQAQGQRGQRGEAPQGQRGEAAPQGQRGQRGEAPEGAPQGQPGQGRQGGLGGRGQAQVELTEEQRQAQIAQELEQNQARLEVPMSKYEEMRKMYNDAGVNIHIVKFDSIARLLAPQVIDHYFEATKALGAIGITMERNEAAAKELAPYADKHKIWVLFHNHTNNYPQLEPDDPIFEYGEYIGLNFDAGHMYCGSDGESPIAIIEKYKDRIKSIHLKDRTPQSAGGGNLPWGEGTTPIVEMLQLARDKEYPFYFDIELEYGVPQDSTTVAEVKKCVEYCRKALLG